MNNSGRFCGIAKMTSEFNQNYIFDYWSSENPWKGIFKLEWLIIKDVPNKFIKSKSIENTHEQNVIYSRDCSEINFQEGLKFIYEYENYPYYTSLLQHFEYYDEREEAYKFYKQKVENIK
jgi:hypothetical protein